MHPIVDILTESFEVTEEQIAPIKSQITPELSNILELKEILLRQKVISDAIFQQAVAKFFDLEYVGEFSITDQDFSEFVEVIPIRYAKKFMFFPFKKDEFTIQVAIENPTNFQPIDDLGRTFQSRMIPVVSHRQAILDLINQAYDRSTSTEQSVDDLDTDSQFESIMASEELEDLLDTTDEEPIKRLVNNLLWRAAKEGVSDIHIDPSQKETIVRYRIDGMLHVETNIPKTAHITVVNRIKVMSRLDIAQKGLPQDGRTMVLIAGKRVDIRVSTVPTVHGEKIVMRLLYQSSNLMQLEDLGLAPRIFDGVQRILNQHGGILLVTGPTGSGKTTTLYASLGQLDYEARNIITIEDPVEYKISGYTQIEINHKLGLTFALALRAVLRQDPDVVMVGEMRDAETAQIAIQAALTGHLVFSTVHTNSAPATITRLVDMGIEPFLVSSTVSAVLAQRLVRKICSACKESYIPHEKQLRELNITPQELEEAGGKFYRGTGCSVCRGTGYKGRIGIHELLVMNEQIKNVMLNTNDSNLIKKAAMNSGMITLRMDGKTKVLQGLTTEEEILAITAED